jgi:hypothetical protein
VAGVIGYFGPDGTSKIGGRAGTLIHESCHAVVSFLVGMPIQGLSAVHDGFSSGRLIHDKQAYLARLAAQRADGIDRGRNDLEQFADLKSHPDFDPGKSWDFAQYLLRTHWPLVQELAWQLGLKGTLTGGQVRRILQKAQKGKMRRWLTAQEADRRNGIAV